MTPAWKQLVFTAFHANVVRSILDKLGIPSKQDQGAPLAHQTTLRQISHGWAWHKLVTTSSFKTPVSWPWGPDAWNWYKLMSIPTTWTEKKVSPLASHGSLSCKPWKNERRSPFLRKSDILLILTILESALVRTSSLLLVHYTIYLHSLLGGPV